MIQRSDDEDNNTAVLAHAKGCFPPALLAILHNLAEVPRPLPSITTIYDSGTQFGYDRPVIRIEGGEDGAYEYYLSIAPHRPDALLIGRYPLWPGSQPEIAVPLSDPGLHGKIAWLVNWTLSPLAVDLPCWGDAEERARLRAELE